MKYYPGLNFCLFFWLRVCALQKDTPALDWTYNWRNVAIATLLKEHQDVLLLRAWMPYFSLQFSVTSVASFSFPFPPSRALSLLARFPIQNNYKLQPLPPFFSKHPPLVPLPRIPLDETEHNEKRRTKEFIYKINEGAQVTWRMSNAKWAANHLATIWREKGREGEREKGKSTPPEFVFVLHFCLLAI